MSVLSCLRWASPTTSHSPGTWPGGCAPSHAGAFALAALWLAPPPVLQDPSQVRPKTSSVLTTQATEQFPSPERCHSQACPAVVAASRGTCTPFSRAPSHEAWGLGLSYPVALLSSSWLTKLTHRLCDRGMYSPHPVVGCWWAGMDVRLGRRAWGAPSPHGPQRAGWPMSLSPSAPASSKHGCPFSLGSLPYSHWSQCPEAHLWPLRFVVMVIVAGAF